LFEKTASNLQEAAARGGQLIVFSDEAAVRLLAYHVAVLKGTDVDQPRNLAKSVTVE
jgi:glucosamine--fructose-6-phosphate aminotransferase (isomerizing)